MKTFKLIALVVLLTLLVEAFLGLRLWTQSTDRPLDADGMQSLYETTDALASPAAFLTGEEALQESGVVDFTVLVAIELYAIAALAIIVLIVLVSGGWHRILALRPVQYPDFVVEQMQPATPRRVWQPVSGSRANATRHYVVHFSIRGRLRKRA